MANKTIFRYGKEYPLPGPSEADLFSTLVAIELRFYLKGFEESPEFISRSHHFMKAAKALWPAESGGFIWHRDAIDMLELACQTECFIMAGNASCGKSEFLALWGMVNWLAAPKDTLVLPCSTTIRDAKRRVWGSLQRLWHKRPGLPGKLTESPSPEIRFIDGAGRKYDNAGIFLIPGDKSKAQDSSGKMLGQKNKRVFVLADELPEMYDSLIETAFGNLITNPYFHFSGAGNPKSMLDPHGKLCKPKEGWASINVEDRVWESERGVVLHLDSLKSENYLAQEDKYPFLTSYKIINAEFERNPNSPTFWRQFRGHWFPGNDSQYVFSESDIIRFKGDGVPIWEGTTFNFAGLDPSFVNGGDKCMARHLQVGKVKGGNWVLYLGESKELVEDVTKLDDPRDFQIARLYKEFCIGHKVPARNSAFDATGAGKSFYSVLKVVWDSSVMPIEFNSRPSDRPVSYLGAEKTAKDIYANRVAEMYFTALDFLRNGQLQGIDNELSKELCNRKRLEQNNADKKIMLEPKALFKSKFGKSPDNADAAMIAIAAACQSMNMWPGATGTPDKRGKVWQDKTRAAMPKLRYGTNLQGMQGPGWNAK